MYKILAVGAFFLLTSLMPVSAAELEELDSEGTVQDGDEEKARGFEAKSDLKLGPVLRGGLPFLTASENIGYLPPLTLNIYGESYLNGSTGITFNWVSSTRRFIPLVAGTTPFSQVGPSGAQTLSKNLLLLSFNSPISYQPGDLFEYGWIAGIASQFVSMNIQLSGETNSNIGLNLGSYLKAYNFYPFVPSVDGKIILGNLYDNGKTFQNNTLSTNIKMGYYLNAGVDIYILKRLLLNLGYSMINPDFLTFSPTRGNPPAAGQPVTGPADDSMLGFEENVHNVTLSLGFLF